MPQFGNWSIEADGILWNGPNTLLIEKGILTEHGASPRDNVYDWLVHTAGKSFLNRGDLNDLNAAFLAALEIYGLEHNPKVSWDETLKAQSKEFITTH